MVDKIKKYKKRPLIIEAIQYEDTFSFALAISEWEGATEKINVLPGECYIETLEGVMNVSVGDYIIRGVNGEFYPCKPDIFLFSYE